MKLHTPDNMGFFYGVYRTPKHGVLLATGFVGELEVEHVAGELLGHVHVLETLFEAWGKGSVVPATLHPLIEGMYAEPLDTGILLKVS